MKPDLNEKRRAYFREYRRKWREANREKYLALNKQVTVKKHATLKRIAELKAEVERLRKAGDAMERSLAFAYPDSPKIKDWNAAKEGKQP